MVIARLFWFGYGLDQFIKEINLQLKNGELELNGLEFSHGFFGIRWLGVATLGKPGPVPEAEACEDEDPY